MNLATRAAKKLIRLTTGRPSPTSPDAALTYQSAGAASKWYMHQLDGYTPADSDFAFKSDATDAGQAAIIERVIRYGRHLDAAAKRLAIAQNNDMWLFISKGHEPLRAAVVAGDAAAVSDLLRQMATGPLVAGFMNVEPYDRLRDRPDIRRIEATHFVDKLLSLGEALGCLPVQGIEQGTRGYAQIDPEQLLGDVAAYVGFDVGPPSAGGGSFGFRSARGVINIKDLNAIYTAHLCRRAADDLPARTVAEIGGGTGTLGYYLRRAGFDRVWLFDLPTVSLIQSYFLMRSLGPDQVWLHGEPPTDAPVRVQPFWTFADEPAGAVSLVVNQDSMPEIERTAALNYLDLVKTRARRFVSINQEGQAKDQFGNAQSVVYQLVDDVGGFRRRTRSLHWMRTGYVEESYDVIAT